MTVEIKGMEYELSTKLRVTKELEQLHGKPFPQILQELPGMDIDGQLTVLYASLKVGGLEMSKDEFYEWAYDRLEYADVNWAARQILPKLFRPARIRDFLV
ncbi:MAG: hypothetical protein LBN43_00990 [Oscillospiraceae bacterium]|jgi:hypothetical protein|nr:hypothetical protein [Oscillospiraceae bacterium]